MNGKLLAKKSLLEKKIMKGMYMEEAKISSKGQLVIPKYLRDALGMQPGSSVLMSKIEDKLMIVSKPIDPVKGLVAAGEKISMKNMRRHIKEE